MYETHWGLTASPFSGQLNSRWFHETPVHEEALARMLFLIEQRRGFGLLGGEPGTGKSLTLRTLAEQVARSQRLVCRINLVGMEAGELLWQVATQLRLAPSEADSRWSLWRRVSDQLAALRMGRTHSVFLLDHLERAEGSCLGMLERLFHEAEAASGHFTFIAAVRSRDMGRLGGLLQDVADLRVELPALRLEETRDLIHGLTGRAGSRRELFDDPAIARIHRHSRGFPRSIHRLCELALIAGMAENRTLVTAELVDSIASSLVSPTAPEASPVPYPEFV